MKFDGKTLYTYKVADNLIEKLFERGYDCIQTDEGVLGTGNWFCIPLNPDKQKYFIIREVYVNSNCSAQTIRTAESLTEEEWDEIEACEDSAI